MELARTKIIACATVIEEMLPLLPPNLRDRPEQKSNERKVS
jgi:hypothetical protein